MNAITKIPFARIPLNTDEPASRPAHPTTGEVISRTKAALSRMGNEGRFSITHNISGEVECFVTHWFRPDPNAFEDCRTVGSGTTWECLDAIDRYADSYRRQSFSDAELGATLGIAAPGQPVMQAAE